MRSFVAVSILGLALATVAAGLALCADGPDDDWQVIERHTTDQAPATQQAPASTTPPGQDASPTELVACGERARPATEPYTSIMATLNQLWGSDAKIYESVAPSGPHARNGGCIFYNAEFLKSFTGSWMGIKDPEHLNEMLYAINAHELGHIVHGDQSPARQDVPLETKELQADRFAGYTLWRLSMERFDAAETEQYYQAVGDDFFGVHASHGSAKQRVDAFQRGWDLARAGLPEDTSERPIGGMDSEPSAQAQ